MLVAHFLARCVVVRVHRRDAINEAQKADYGGKHEHLRVEAEPTEVERNFVAKIFTDEAERLTFVPRLERMCPLEVKELD